MTHPDRDPQPDQWPFYIEPDCCLLCGVPESIAPDLFHTGEESCSFVRQPSSQRDIDRTIEAMWSSEVDCVRYGGADAGILQRLGEAELTHLADDARARRFPPIRRDRVVFPLRSVEGRNALEGLAAAFREYLLTRENITVAREGFLRKRRRVCFSWYGNETHSVTFDHAGDRLRFVAILVPAQRHALKGLARVVDAWLKTVSQAGDIEWHSRATLVQGEAGAPSPF